MSRWYLLVLLTVNVNTFSMWNLGAWASTITDNSDDELDPHIIDRCVKQIGQAHETQLDLSRMSPNTQWDRVANIDGIATVRNIHLNNNQLPPTISQHLACAKRLTCLDLSSCQLREVPDGLQHFETLIYIDLSCNKLQDISQGALPSQINSLILHSNQFEKMPFALRGLALTYLDIKNNKITTIEDGDLPENIETVDLSSNKFTSIPPPLESLAKLKILFLWNNSISSEEVGWFETKNKHNNIQIHY